MGNKEISQIPRGLLLVEPIRQCLCYFFYALGLVLIHMEVDDPRDAMGS